MQQFITIHTAKVIGIIATIAIGLAILFSTFSGSSIAKAIPLMQQGSLSVELDGERWYYNNALVTQSELSQVNLQPGDSLTLIANAVPKISGSLTTELAFHSNATTGLLASKAVEVDWKIAGKKAPLALTAEDTKIPVPVAWTLKIVKPFTGSEQLDLSHLIFELHQA